MAFIPYLGVIWLAVILFLTAKHFLLPQTAQVTNSSVNKFISLAFPSSTHEIVKLGFLRFVFGIVLLIRAAHEWCYILPQDIENPIYFYTLIGTTILSIFIMVGFLTTVSLVTIILILFGERSLRASTLGNDVGAIFSILLVFAGAHHSLSMDRFLQGKWSKWMKYSGNKLFSHSLKEMPQQISLFKFTSILSYWCLCLYSAFKHYDEPSWMTSDASIWLLTSSYLNGHFEIFREILSVPAIESFFRYSMWLMFPWYILFLPAFFIGGILNKINLAWWFIFLLLSAFTLQLGSLGYIEIVYFSAIAFVPLSRHKKQIEFFYDSKCNLCQRIVKAVRALDISRRVRFISAQSSEEFLNKNGVSLDDALAYLAGHYEGRMYKGYDLYMLLTSKLPALWIFYPILKLGKILTLGPRIYQKIANSRINLFGVCQLPPIRPSLYKEFRGNFWNKIFIKSTFLTICLFAVLFLTFLPTGKVHESKLFEPFEKFYYAANIVGIAAINVFNKDDLQMSTHWRILEYCEDESHQKCSLVPMTGKDGRQLHYHSSDSVYYGGSLRWRRAIIDEEAVCDYGAEKFSMTEYLHQVAKLYMRKENLESGFFKLTYHYLPLPDLQKDDWSERWNDESFVCNRYFKL